MRTRRPVAVRRRGGTAAPARASVVAYLVAVSVPALVAGVLVDGVSFDERLWLAAAAAAGALLASVSVPRTIATWMPVLWAAAAVGAIAQLRLHAVTVAQAALLLVAAGAAFAAAAFVAKACAARGVPLGGVALATLAAVMLGIRLLPAVVAGGDLENGRLPVPAFGSVQIGEFTRVGLIVTVALALAAWQRTRRGTCAPLVVAFALVAAQLVVLAVFDAGPAVITLVGCLAAWAPLISRLRLRGRWLGVSVVVVAAASVAVFAVTNSALTTGVMQRAVARIAALDDPDPQLALARAAVAEGGIVGPGVGRSALAGLIPAGRSDHVVAVLVADLGVFVVGALIVAVLLAYLAAMRRLDLRRAGSRTAAAMLFASAVQLVWAALGSLAIAPVTGVSAPWLAATGSALVSTAIATGIGFGLGTRRVVGETVLADGMRVLIAVIAVASVVVALGPWPRAAFADLRERGAIVTRDGQVLAEGGGVSAADPGGARAYSGGAATAVVTGRTFGMWGSGQVGLEATSAAQLTCGGPLPWWSFAEALVHPVPCEPADVVSTIDGDWQAAGVAALDGYVGGAVVLDAMTGDLLVLADTTVDDPAEWTTDGSPEPLTTFDAVAPGSVIKPLVAAVAWQEGVDAAGAPRDELVLDEAVVLNAGRARCADTSIAGAIEQSCNTVFAQLAINLGEERLADGLREHFGADDAVSFDGGAAVGIVTGIDDVDEAQLARSGIGQESMVATPLSIASAYSVLVASASGWSAPATHLVAATCADGLQVVPPAEADVVPVDGGVARRVLDAMSRTITGEHGTMHVLSSAVVMGGLTLAAKSGTAEVPSQVSSSGYVHWATVVVGDRFVVTTQVRHAAGGNAASAVAADLVERIDWMPSTPTCR